MSDYNSQEIIEATKDYILSLPNGSNLSMWQAIKKACPGFQEPNEFFKLFDLHNAICEAIEKKDTVLDFSDHDGKLEGLPFHLDFYVWHKRLQKVQIVSNLICYGPEPDMADPVEQHLTISFSGRVWFSEFLYGNGFGTKHPIGRKMQFSIGKGRTARILSFIADYMEEDRIDSYIMDIGSWEMKAFKVDGSVYRCGDSMDGQLIAKDVNLSELIRTMVGVDDLSVFGEIVDSEDID